MPQDLVADEKITWLAGEEVVVPTTVGGGCVLGISVAEQATSASLQDAYGEFKTEATAVFPAYQPRSVCTDGFQATRDAWRQLFPHLTLVLCFLALHPQTHGALPRGVAPPGAGSGVGRLSRRDERAVRPTPAPLGGVGAHAPSTGRWRR